MAITAIQVREKIERYIPEGNILTDQEIEELAQELITKIGDDDSNLPRISCELLQQIASINDVLFGVDDAGLKSEKLGRRTLTWDTATVADSWKEYGIKVKEVICPILGYETKTRKAVGVFISSGEKICVNGTEYP